MSETSGGCVYDGDPLEGVKVDIGGDGRIALAGPVLFTGYRHRPPREGDCLVTSAPGRTGGCGFAAGPTM